MAAMRTMRAFGASVAHVVASEHDAPGDAILARKMWVIETINSDLEVRSYISMAERF